MRKLSVLKGDFFVLVFSFTYLNWGLLKKEISDNAGEDETLMVSSLPRNNIFFFFYHWSWKLWTKVIRGLEFFFKPLFLTFSHSPFFLFLIRKVYFSCRLLSLLFQTEWRKMSVWWGVVGFGRRKDWIICI